MKASRNKNLTVCGILAAVIGLAASVVFPRPRAAFQDLASAGKLPGFSVSSHRYVKFDVLFPIHAWRVQQSPFAFNDLLRRFHFAPQIGAGASAQKRSMEKLFGLPHQSLESYDLYVGDNRRVIERVLVSKDQMESFYEAFGYI